MSNRVLQLRTRRLRGAFTLIELLVVIVIMAILAAVVVPTIGNISGLQATSAARILASDLQYAQNVAITHQQSVTVTFDTSGESYSLSNTSGVLIHPITKEAYTVAFSADEDFGDLDIVSASFTGGAVTFDSLGVPNNSGTVKLQAGPSEYEVTVAPATGKVTVDQTSS